MKTTHEVDAASFVRRFSGKTILTALFFTSAVFSAAGCSDAVQPATHPDCVSLTAAHAGSPAIRVSVKANIEASPDVTISGNGFPAGAPISIGYFGLPASGNETSEIDLPASENVSADGSFTVTQRGVYEMKSCDGDFANDTISVAVGAEGTIAGALVPTRFWCSNAATTESYDGPCE
jgi:hypothetical protein